MNHPALLIIAYSIGLSVVTAQLNLGSFDLFRNGQGDLELGLGQGGSLFGFGGDRSTAVQIGPGRFGTKTGSGVMLGGERIGVDSHLGLEEGKALGLGSILNLGNKPVNPMKSVGQLSSLINNLGAMFVPHQSPPRIPDALRPPSVRPPSGLTVDEEQFPMGRGAGWDGDTATDSQMATPFPTLVTQPPPGARNVPPSRTGITTEGMRRQQGGEADLAISGRNDGETGGGGARGGAPPAKGLPVLEGLEPISNTDVKIP